jgi:hypothetical protein
MILKLKNDFIVEDLGIREEWVYDIEVKDNHNFFANNILVHNSAYLLFDLPFNKFDDIRQLVDYIQQLSTKIDTEYNNALNYYGSMFAGLNPEFNIMKFKSEVVAYQGFFNTKKFYALSKAWDEGAFFDTPEIKKTGGQIKKADVTKISEQLLSLVYKILVLPSETKDLESLYKKIFIETKNRIKMQLKHDIDNLDFKSFGVPKKWSFKATKDMQWVTGARLYNQIVEDLHRPGDSMLTLPIKGNFNILQNYDEQLSLKNKDLTYLLKADDYNDISTLSIPPNMNSEQVQKLSVAFEKYSIRVDFDQVMLFNIDMKLEVFEKLFPPEIKLLVKGD